MKPAKIHYFIRDFRATVTLAFCVFLPRCCLSADEFVDAGMYSWWHRSGLFCFRVGSNTNTEVHLARYHDGKFDEEFAKRIGHTVMTPICFSNEVVIVSADGVVQKLDHKGDSVFVGKPKGFIGAAGWSGRVSDKCIFLTESTYQSGNRDVLYRLYIVDVAGAAPFVKATYNIARPLRVVEVADEVIVIEPTNVFRVRPPE